MATRLPWIDRKIYGGFFTVHFKTIYTALGRYTSKGAIFIIVTTSLKACLPVAEMICTKDWTQSDWLGLLGRGLMNRLELLVQGELS